MQPPLSSENEMKIGSKLKFRKHFVKNGRTTLCVDILCIMVSIMYTKYEQRTIW